MFGSLKESHKGVLLMNNYIEKNKQKHKLYKETLELVGDKIGRAHV